MTFDPHTPQPDTFSALWSDEGRRSATIGHRVDRVPPREPPARPAGGRKRGPRPPLAVLLVASALMGGGASAGILAGAGFVNAGASETTTIVEPAISPISNTTNGDDLDAAALYAGTSAGVVDISVTGTSSAQAARPFGRQAPQQETSGSGSGFVVDEEGHIITAAHVVDNASSITVKFEDGTARKATMLGHDDSTDIAVLKIDPSGVTLHPLKLGSSASIDVGDEVAAIGGPFGYERSLSTGIVSAVDRTIEAPNGFTVAHAIQTDAAMNPGNSGGPVLNAAGEVVGIADQIATNGNSQQSSGVGFAVPIDLVKSSLETLKAGAPVRHAYLGVAVAGTSTTTPGVTVGDVTTGGPAAEAGLRAGDVITRFDETAIADSNDLVAAIAEQAPGDEASIAVTRGSETIEMTVTLGTQPAQSSTAR